MDWDEKCGWSGWVTILNRGIECYVDFIEKLMFEQRLIESEKIVYVRAAG